MGLPGWLSGKESACQCRRHGFDPWVRKILWRRKWQPTPVFLPGDSHGQESLVGCSPWSCKESDRTEPKHKHPAYNGTCLKGQFRHFCRTLKSWQRASANNVSRTVHSNQWGRRLPSLANRWQFPLWGHGVVQPSTPHQLFLPLDTLSQVPLELQLLKSSCVLSRLQSCPVLFDPVDCNPPGSSIHGILQASILESATISFSRESSWPKDWTFVS